VFGRLDRQRQKDASKIYPVAGGGEADMGSAEEGAWGRRAWATLDRVTSASYALTRTWSSMDGSERPADARSPQLATVSSALDHVGVHSVRFWQFLSNLEARGDRYLCVASSILSRTPFVHDPCPV
jgi:hypothetical protein